MGALAPPDWHAVGREADFEPDEMDEWLGAFRAIPADDADVLEFGSGDDLAVRLRRLVHPDRLVEGTEEAQERLEDIDGLIVRRVRSHLVSTKAILSFELDWGALDSPAACVAHELALWAAERWAGLVLSIDDAWIDPSVSRTEALIEPA